MTWWCYLTISSSPVPFSSCPQPFPASGSFPMSCLFASGGQRTGASASASVLPMKIQGWFLSGLTGLISLLSKGLSRVSSSTTIQKCQFFCTQTSLWSYSHIHTSITGKTIALTIQTFVSKVISLLFNTLSRFVTVFLPRSKHLLISWLQSPSAVILEPKKIKSVYFFLFCLHEVMRPGVMVLILWMLSFKPAFPLSSFTLNKRFFSSSSLSAIRVVSSA